MKFYVVGLAPSVQGPHQCLSIGRVFQRGKTYELTEAEFQHPQLQEALRNRKLVLAKTLERSEARPPVEDIWTKAEAVLTRLIDRVAKHVKDIQREAPAPVYVTSPQKSASRVRRPKEGIVEELKHSKPVKRKPKRTKEESPDLFLASADRGLSASVEVESESESGEELNSAAEALKKLREGKE